jgi:aminoglycoside phosphotransferase (APT) family kinase protein
MSAPWSRVRRPAGRARSRASARGGPPAALVEIDLALVRRLLSEQFPQWATLPLERVSSAGTDNAIFRLGPDMSVRLPRVDWAVGQVEKEQRWLPRLAGRLPLQVPVPLGAGIPGAGYPWRWSVYSWLEGETPSVEDLAHQREAAVALAEFVAALGKIDASGGPAAGEHNFFRGVPLAMRDALFRESIASLGEAVDAVRVREAWESALRTPVWGGPPVWVHGDIHAGNLLVHGGRLSAVIDFGGLGVGDPACDRIVAWNLLSPENRRLFREALADDDDLWARGRGWALSIALIALPYYQKRNPAVAAGARHTIEQVLADLERST